MLAIYDMQDLENKGIETWDLSMAGKVPEDAGIEPIVVTYQHFDLGQVLIIEGVAYSIVSSSRGGKSKYSSHAFVRKLPKQIPFTSNDTDASPRIMYDANDLQCPFCGTKFYDIHEMSDHEDNYECPVCNSTFSYEREVKVSFTIVPGHRSEPKTFSYDTESEVDDA